jgi:hypothetical protein
MTVVWDVALCSVVETGQCRLVSTRRTRNSFPEDSHLQVCEILHSYGEKEGLDRR